MNDISPAQIFVPLSLDEIKKGHPTVLSVPTVVPESAKMEFITILFLLMTFFFVMAACNDKFKPKCGHQTSFTIILGISAALVLWFCFQDSRVEMYKFDPSVFFNFLLPPLILNSGYNMRRKKFF